MRGQWLKIGEMRDLADSVFDTIGDTPMVRLKLPSREKVGAEILVKLEFTNPTGSLKDRIYREMITTAIERGDLKPGMEIIEASTGNAGIACSFVGTRMGYRVTIVMPEGMSNERKQLISAFGGALTLTPGGESDVDLCTKKVGSVLRANPRKYWFPDQFSNSSNPAAHYKTTAPEIWSQSEGKVDCFLASQGTGGTLTGVGRYLRERSGAVRLYAVEPREAPILARSQWGTHRIEGIGDGFVPRNLDLSMLTGVVTVTSEEAIEMTRRLLREEGIFCGISSGCNVAAAIKVAKAHPELKRIVTMINDSGNRYLSTEVFGKKKALKVPKRRHRLDRHSLEQLKLYQRKFEVVED